MSEFIKLTKITVAWDRQEPMTNVFAVKPVNIISLTETEINNIKCTEIEAACNNGVIRYFVKESIDEILRKIDPPKRLSNLFQSEWTPKMDPNAEYEIVDLGNGMFEKRYKAESEGQNADSN